MQCIFVTHAYAYCDIIMLLAMVYLYGNHLSTFEGSQVVYKKFWQSVHILQFDLWP